MRKIKNVVPGNIPTPPWKVIGNSRGGGGGREGGRVGAWVMGASKAKSF